MYRIGFKLLATLLLCFASVSTLYAEDLAVTVLFDNFPFREGLQTGWAFSCIIEGAEKTILFDTGASGKILLENMEKLNVSPESVDVMAFSHLHPDHTDGAMDFWKKNSNVAVYIPGSWPDNIKGAVKNAAVETIEFHEPVEICKDVYTTEDIGTGMWGSGTVFGVSATAELREQGLVIRTTRGLVVVTGCAHPGIVKIVKRAKEILNEDVYLVMGGFHMLQMDTQAIENVIKELRDENVRKVSPTHCTGELAISLFKKEYGDDFIPAGVGKEIKIEDAFPEEVDIGLQQETRRATWGQVKVTFKMLDAASPS